MTTLKEGDQAPDFSGPDQDGNIVSLSGFRGKRLVLYFYPQDDTPTCTAQACNLRDNYGTLRKKGWEVLGISVDSTKSHKKFEKKYKLPFTLVADEDHQIVNRYGVFGQKTLFGRTYMGIHRTTFLINEKGIIDRIISPPEARHQAEQVLALWE